MSLEISDRLEHILNETIYLIEIRKYFNNQEDIERDETLKRSVVRSLEIIGEATKTLPPALLQKHQNIDWRNISRMRDNLIHRYFKVNYEVVWTVITNEIPKLNTEVQKMLRQIYRAEYLTYKQQIETKQGAELISMDIEIAKNILQEYIPKFKSVAISKIERILSHSDFAVQLKYDSNSVKSYLTSIIKSLE